MQDLIDALKILSGYLIEGDYLYNYPTNCDHDVLRVCVDYNTINEKDLARLKELGFVPDENTGYMVSYRFGSN